MSYSSSADRAPGMSGASQGRGTERNGIRMSDTIRIRKYPNRRLYDTSRSQHLTHDGVLALIAEGHTVQVTDSRTGTDITNAVLLQIMIERDPAKVGSLPSEIIHRAMRSDVTTIRSIADGALAAWRGESPDAPGSVPAASATAPRPATNSMTGGNSVSSASTPRTPSASVTSAPPTSLDMHGRPKAKAKRADGSVTDVG